MDGYPILIDDPFKLRNTDPIDITLSMEADSGTVDLNGFGSSWFATLRWSDQVESGYDFTVDTTTGISAGKLLYIVLHLSGTRSPQLSPDHKYVFDVEARGGSDTPNGVWRGYIQTDGAVTRA